MPASGDEITALLLRVTQQGELVAALDAREAGHHRETAARLDDLAHQARDISENLADLQAAAAQHAATVSGLDDLEREIAALTARIAALTGRQDGDDGGYQPAPAPRWWKLTGTERDAAIARLRAWTEQVYRPSYGHLAASLGPCWEQHPLCLHGLDWLMELWSVLYLTDERTPGLLASQAEWQTRLLPALAEQMYLETSRCQHAKAGIRRPGGTGSPRASRSEAES